MHHSYFFFFPEKVDLNYSSPDVEVLINCLPSSVCLWTFRIFDFSRTTPPEPHRGSSPIFPISTNLGTKHHQVKGIQVLFPNEGPRHFLRGDNYRLRETLDQFQPNLAQSILGWKEFKFVKWKTTPFSKGR